jgi:hypothetical protein
MSVHYFSFSLTLVFSSGIPIKFIRQSHDGRSFVQHGCIVLHYRGISEYHVTVGMATAVEASDV